MRKSSRGDARLAPPSFSKVYLDICCLKRPFDDQTQLRIHLESEAVLWILKQVENGGFALVGSEALELENSRNTNLQRRNRIEEILNRIPASISLEDSIKSHALELEELGFKPMDALHIASAEQAAADVFISCDDQLLNAARRNRNRLEISVMNPLDTVWSSPQ